MTNILGAALEFWSWRFCTRFVWGDFLDFLVYVSGGIS